MKKRLFCLVVGLSAVAWAGCQVEMQPPAPSSTTSGSTSNVTTPGLNLVSLKVPNMT
jgi:hypothetical protein